MKDFTIISELGWGSYGTVYKVESTKDGKIYVLKKINLKHLKPKHQEAAVKEAQILKTINHPHVIKYFTSFMEDGCLHILMEYADGGDLYELLKSQKKKWKYFSEKDLWIFAYEILLGLEYLHSKNVIHWDIKTLNIFIS